MKNRKYDFATIRYDELKEKVEVPQFQRSLVWSNKTKSEFINTVKEGNPFGSILVHKTMGKYEIIDGLQRFTTLIDYETHPEKYIDMSIDSIPEIKDISYQIKSLIPHLAEEKLNKEIIEDIHMTLEDNALSDPKLSRKIRQNIVSRYNESITVKVNDNIEDILDSIVRRWQSEINLRELEIPAIIYTGDGSDLPDIFEKLNTGGTKLSRYEVFASTWNNIKLNVDDEKLLDYIEDSYKRKSEKTNLAISNYEEGRIKKEKIISLYELCFAFGKKIKDETPILFATYSDTEEDQVDSIGFTSLATALNIPLKKLAILNNYVNENTNMSKLNILMDTIIKSYKQIEEILRNYISTVDKKVFTKFVEAQVLAILGTHFRLFNVVHDDLSITPADVSKTTKENFKRYMPYAYLYDILSEYWAGSGDRKLAEEMEKPIEENRFVSLILKDKWRTLLEEWMKGQILKKVKNVSVENKLFLNFICKTRIEWHDNQCKYDIEHIIPKKRIADKHMDVAVSSIGNLCLLPVRDNRAKKEETLYEFLDRTSEVSDIDEEKALRLYYPTRDELSFIRAGVDFNESNYERFLKDRNNYLINEFLNLIE